MAELTEQAIVMAAQTLVVLCTMPDDVETEVDVLKRAHAAVDEAWTTAIAQSR